MASPLEIVAVPAFADNYLWLVHDPESGETAVVDPGDPAPVMAEAGRRGWRIDKILNTHWHPDHTGGNLAIKEATGATIIGPDGENGRVPGLDVALKEGDRVRIGAHQAEVELRKMELKFKVAMLQTQGALLVAKQFATFVGSEAGRAIMRRYGFLLPGESVAETK